MFDAPIWSCVSNISPPNNSLEVDELINISFSEPLSIYNVTKPITFLEKCYSKSAYKLQKLNTQKDIISLI